MSNLELVVAEAKKLGFSEKVDSGVLISTGVKLAAFVNNIPGLKGKDKSELVVSALLKCIDEIAASKGAEEKALYENLKDTARLAVPSAIQAVIDVSNGKFSIKTVKASTLLSWFSCMASSAVSIAASSGVLTQDQVKAAGNVLEKVEKVEKVVEKVEAGASVIDEVKEVAADMLPAVAAEAEKVLPASVVEQVMAKVEAAVAVAEVPAPVAEVVVVELPAVAEVPAPVAETPPVPAEK
jgi:hypothetical protein